MFVYDKNKDTFLHRVYYYYYYYYYCVLRMVGIEQVI